MIAPGASRGEWHPWLHARPVENRIASRRSFVVVEVVELGRSAVTDWFMGALDGDAVENGRPLGDGAHASVGDVSPAGRPARARAAVRLVRQASDGALGATVGVAREMGAASPCTGSSLCQGQPPKRVARKSAYACWISLGVFITNGPFCTTGSPMGRPCSSSSSASVAPFSSGAERRRAALRRLGG